MWFDFVEHIFTIEFQENRIIEYWLTTLISTVQEYIFLCQVEDQNGPEMSSFIPIRIVRTLQSIGHSALAIDLTIGGKVLLLSSNEGLDLAVSIQQPLIVLQRAENSW